MYLYLYLLQKYYYPTEPSSVISNNLFASTANSIGSLLTTSFTKPFTIRFIACLNSAVFTDGSFCYIPKGVRCPMELSTYFRINEANTGQFERTLIICEDDAYVSYLEGCTAPARDDNQLHAACVHCCATLRTGNLCKLTTCFCKH